MLECKDKTGFVTGGGNGVGFGIAEELISRGGKVVIADIREDAVASALERLGPRADGVVLDVSDAAAFTQAAQTAWERHGAIDFVFNNAGVNLFAPAEKTTLQDWQWILGVNLWGVIHGVQAFVPNMRARGQGGWIVNTASMAAWLPSSGAAAYSAAKAAVLSLSECLRWSLAKDRIRVQVVCPGLVDSAIYRSDEIRPEHLLEARAEVDPAFMQRLPDVQRLGMSGREMGRRILDRMGDNRAWIFTHPDHADELCARFARIGQYFPDDIPDPGRKSIEDMRRQSIIDSEALAQALRI